MTRFYGRGARVTCLYIYIYRKGVFVFALIYNLALVDLQLKKNKTDIIHIYIFMCLMSAMETL